MPTTRIALANVRTPSTPDESIEIVIDAMKVASQGDAAIICFPECVIPGYPIGTQRRECDQDWLDDAWSCVDKNAAELSLCVVLGTERLEGDNRLLTVRVTNPDGSLAGFQDKVQLDPSEETTYTSGTSRHLFQCDELKFGIVICHEGWRYPETVRWAAKNGAHIVFHPHFEIVEDPQFMPIQFADPRNTFHEKAALCRAAENTCYFATVNCALPGATTTSALIDPDGALVTHQTYGKEGVLLADIDHQKATGFLAKRLRSNPK
jgi:predicted amidohydrolase